ncbi:MAG: hypothetical protein HP038_08135 [Bacteroides sp.]|nr:hypothetical protein [Bacteroides sp.]
MKPNIIHSIVVCLTAFTLPFMVACGSQEESLPDNVTEAVLYLNITTIGQTRASTAELPDNEKMKSVRVIVLHADGTVEHNRHFSLDGAHVQKYILLKVRPNEQKKIFLFANEESVSTVEGVNVAGENQTLTDFFESYTVNTPGFEAAVNNLYFAPDYSGGKPIPMSSMYEIDFPEKENFDGTFYVVRVATKFTCRFKNFRSGAVTVNSISVSNIANDSYLMAHKQNPTMKFTEEDNGISELFWIDWLKKVSDESQEHPEDKTLADKRGWIMDYDIPESAVQAPTGQTNLKLSVPKADNTDVNQEQGTLYTFYLPESKDLIEPTGTYGEQRYKMTLGLIDEHDEQKSFNFAFDNLKALFRNTNAVIDIIMYDREVVVDVIPYSEVVLEPEFGL